MEELSKQTVLQRINELTLLKAEKVKEALDGEPINFYPLDNAIRQLLDVYKLLQKEDKTAKSEPTEKPHYRQSPIEKRKGKGTSVKIYPQDYAKISALRKTMNLTFSEVIAYCVQYFMENQHDE